MGSKHLPPMKVGDKFEMVSRDGETITIEVGRLGDRRVRLIATLPSGVTVEMDGEIICGAVAEPPHG